MLALVTVFFLETAYSDLVINAFRTLQDSHATEESVSEAGRIIAEHSPDDDLDTVGRLLALVESKEQVHWRTPAQAAMLACLKGGDRTAPRILETISKLLDDNIMERRDRGFILLSEAVKRLACRVSNTDPIARLAVERNCVGWLTYLECKPETREQYLLESLLQPSHRAYEGCCGPALGSLACYISDASIPEVRRTMRALRESDLRPDSFDIALRTLVEMNDQDIIPDLELLRADSRSTAEQRALASVYLVKLRSQHAVRELISILANERENRALLMWAVRRLLWLKVSKAEIQAALGNGAHAGGHVHALASEVDTYFFGTPPLQPAWAKQDVDLLILDRLERCTAQAELAKNPTDLRKRAPYTLGTLVDRAPP